jgi:succinylglutamate desuccinylase
VTDTPRIIRRVLGRVRGDAPGPTLVALGAIHGNEPAGVHAANRVLSSLEEQDVRGELVALAGNRGALSHGVRFIHRDLNRGWTDEAIARERAAADEGVHLSAENREQLELLDAIGDVVRDARGPVFFLDLHTTSAPGIPFVVADGRESDHRFALAFGLPVFFGLSDRLASALTPFLCRRGITAVAVEGGQNDSESAVLNHEAVIRIALAETGVVARDAACASELATCEERLRDARRGLPQAIEVYHRHAIRPDDGFRMEPGFANIQPIAAGTLLARDKQGEIRANEDCLVVMPLYQGLGDDGFFLGRALA